jgi:hypothetical protein
MSALGLASRFLVAGAIGVGATLGIGAATTPAGSNLLLPARTDYELTADTGDVHAAFSVVGEPGGAAGAGGQSGAGASPGASAAEPVVLAALPDDAHVTLVAYTDGPPPDTSNPDVRPNWLASTGYPRVNPITQFDGGPLANANCTMTSGAMLARLGFGIIATGSQLRSLQPDQVGGTSLADLEVSIEKFGVHFNRAPLTALQLRALLYSGAGAVIQGTYGIIPVDLRLQKNFTGGHAIYLDGFRPASAAGPAAYFVIDPLGRPGAGYRGAWWPADIIEAFGEAFGGGSIYSAWTFPGGQTPTSYPALPPNAFPSGHYVPGATPEPSPTPEPGATSTPAPTPPALPSPDPSFSAPPAGDETPAPPTDTGDWVIHVDPGTLVISLAACASASPPAWCPDGIVAVMPDTPAPVATLPPLTVQAGIELLYANQISPDTIQVIFSVPDGTLPALEFWNETGGTGSLGFASSIEPAMLDGRPVQVAQVPVTPGGTYDFLASAAGAGIRAVSRIGVFGP